MSWTVELKSGSPGNSIDRICLLVIRYQQISIISPNVLHDVEEVYCSSDFLTKCKNFTDQPEFLCMLSSFILITMVSFNVK